MTIDRGRVRWHCRRALLELDLVLSRFLDEEFDQLSDEQLVNMQELLDLEDHELWAMVNGSKECTETRWMPIIGMLRHPGAESSSGKTQ